VYKVVVRFFGFVVQAVSAAWLTWSQIAVHHQRIADRLAVPEMVATIAQRLRNDHHVEV
jgi:hypothetical protein